MYFAFKLEASNQKIYLFIYLFIYYFFFLCWESLKDQFKYFIFSYFLYIRNITFNIWINFLNNYNILLISIFFYSFVCVCVCVCIYCGGTEDQGGSD